MRQINTQNKNEPVKKNNRNVYPTNRNELNKMDMKIRFLRGEAKKRKAEAHGALDTQIRVAEAQFELLKARLEQAGQKTDAVADEFKKGIEKAWQDISTSVERASKYLN